MIIGKNIKRLSKVDSTNNYTIKLLRQSDMPEGLVVVADEQTAGRGQRGNDWQSDAGMNLTFSLLLKPGFLQAHQQFYLNKAVTTGIAEFITRNSHCDAWIKWPNDILVNDHKISGVLIENTLRGDKIENSVVGIGLNVNQKDFPKSLNQPTSLTRLTGKSFDLDLCLQQLCSCIEANYLRLRNNIHILDGYYEQKLFGKGAWRSFMINNDKIIAIIEGVTGNGLLVLRNKEGKTMQCNFQEIKFIF